MRRPRATPEDGLPDVRDGLTRVERIVLVVLAEAQRERRGRNVSTAMLYGRVAERVAISPAEFQRVLDRLVGARVPEGVAGSSETGSASRPSSETGSASRPSSETELPPLASTASDEEP